MTDWLGDLTWPAVVAYAVWRLAPVASLFAPGGGSKPEPNIPIPDDLVGLIQQYESEWAKEDVAKVIRERWDLYRDWDKVRKSMGVAPTPARS